MNGRGSGLGLSVGIPKDVVFLGLSFGVGLACGGGGGGGGGSIFDLLDIEEQRTWNIRCDCFEQIGFESKQECQAAGDGDQRPPELTECFESLLEEHPDITNAANCQLNARRTLNNCVQTVPCEDRYDYYQGYSQEYYDCLVSYVNAIGMCPEVSEEAQDAMDMCAEWPCADGDQTIYIGFVCDGDQDCQDGSDEAMCSGVMKPPVIRALGPEALYFAG